jgi:inosine-uridine nucleoside N-ribohydrolase
MPLLFVPCDVTVQTFFTVGQLERLRGGDALCRALAGLVDVWAALLRKLRGGRGSDDVVAVLHDPLTVACTVETRFVKTRRMPVSVTMHQGSVRTFVDPLEGRMADVVTEVDAGGFGDFFLRTILGDNDG